MDDFDTEVRRIHRREVRPLVNLAQALVIGAALSSLMWLALAATAWAVVKLGALR